MATTLSPDSRVYVAGHAGLVGSAIVRRLQAEGFHNILTATRHQVDLRNQAEVSHWFKANRPEYVFLVAGTVLPFAGKALAEAYGWNASFVGTLLVAAATSLPELVVTVAALRIGALDMAIANLLGSNLFDLLVIAIDDLFYLPGPILAHVSPVHAASALSAIVMTGAVMAGFVYRPKSRVLGTIGWASVFLLAVYVLNSYLLFLRGA